MDQRINGSMAQWLNGAMEQMEQWSNLYCKIQELLCKGLTITQGSYKFLEVRRH
jgi:hypothetical protein